MADATAKVSYREGQAAALASFHYQVPAARRGFASYAKTTGQYLLTEASWRRGKAGARVEGCDEYQHPRPAYSERCFAGMDAVVLLCSLVFRKTGYRNNLDRP